VKLVYNERFRDDLRALPKTYRKRLEEVLLKLKSADNLSEIPTLKRLQGHRNYFRIRLGEYRIGGRLNGGVLELMRCMHRRDIYRRFP